MTIVTNEGYIARRVTSCRRKRKQQTSAQSEAQDKKCYRDWWLVKIATKNSGCINLHGLTLPKKYLGKKVRFKVEIIEEKPIKEETTKEKNKIEMEMK